MRDLAGINALTGLARLRVRPLALLPKKQIAALAKRGVDIEDLDAVPPPREIVITYRPSDLPAEMTKSLPAQAGPRQCLFFIAVADSPAIVALFDNLPEPDIDHVDEGMALSDRVLRALHRSGELLGLLGVGVSDDCDTPYSSGFHAADADEVEAFLRERGCDLVPVTDLLPGATR